MCTMLVKACKRCSFKRVMPVHKAQPQQRTFTDMVRSEETSIPHLVKIDDEDELYEEILHMVNDVHGLLSVTITYTLNLQISLTATLS
ncbi:unnamed protein product [Cylicostephanus goldi]|uniref:Uncharacterized protein n=1 Tax=Cylicostephanus goldi TaxID=71465 RepID=A0A3P6RAR0_CYLGO|nr:unnamed protein product [Cylicostephanus goldi]